MLFYLFFLSLSPIQPKALSSDNIFKTNDASRLKQLIQQSSQKSFLTELCKKQKETKKIPVACYELSLNADFWCLNLKLEEPSRLKNVKKALKSKFLSKKCLEHLKIKEKILIYRQKDFLRPELKIYFTAEKPFF